MLRTWLRLLAVTSILLTLCLKPELQEQTTRVSPHQSQPPLILEGMASRRSSDSSRIITVPFNLEIDHWSTDTELQIIKTEFDNGGLWLPISKLQSAAVFSAPSIGFDDLALTLPVARLTVLSDNTRKIVLLSIGACELDKKNPYLIQAGEIKLYEKAEGEGFLLACSIIELSSSGRLEIKSSKSPEIQLTHVVSRARDPK